MTVTRQPTDLKFQVSRDGRGASDADLTALTGATSDNVIAAAKLAADGTTVNGLLSSSATGAVGYTTGAGGAVTQITSRSTGVTLSTLCGTITTDSTSLAAAAEATFTVTNTLVVATDVVVCCVKSGGTTSGSTWAAVTRVAAGAFDITVSNLHASTADTAALLINFAVLRSVAA
jgi:hypothetical protein